MSIVLAEIVAAGIYNTDVAVKNKAITNTRKTTMFEIEIPLEKGGVSYIDLERMNIDTDIIICAKPGQTRRTRLPYKCYYIHIILKDGLLYDTLVSVPDFINVGNNEKLYGLFKRICRYYDTKLEVDEIMLQGLVLELIYEITKASERVSGKKSMKSNNHTAIEKAIDYIKQNLTTDLSLETVAGYVGFSQIHFHNCFKASTGKTLHEYVEEQRIKTAVNLLITTNKTLTEIAYESGFSSQSYFSYVFKRRMKCTPREYVKSLLDKYEAKI